METYGIQPNNIPDDWKRLAQWVLWRRELVGGKPTKVPYMAAGRKAKTNDPATWDSFENVIIAPTGDGLPFDGIGFVLTEYDPFCILDMDGCRNPDTGELKPEAANLVSQFATYTEITPSQTGVRVVLRGTKPGNGCQKAGVYGCSKLEIYDHLRFVTVTGNVLQSELLPVESRQRELDDLHVELFPPKSAKKGTERAFRPLPSQSGETSTPEILARAFRAKNGAAIQSLWRGDTSAYGGDESRADLALCSYLAFYTGDDAARLDALFRESGLMREKWDSPRPGGTYGSNTIAESLKDKTEFWQPAGITQAKRGNDPPPATKTDTENDNRSKRETEREAKAAKRSERAVRVSLADGLPIIETNGEHLRDITDRSLDALRASNNPPVLFVRAGELVRIGFDEQSRPAIQTHTIASLRGVLARCANFVSTSDDRGALPVAPPKTTVEDIACLPNIGGIPPLVGIVTAPVVAVTGELETSPGYLSKSRLYYNDGDGRLLPDSEPTPENVAAAKSLLIETLLADFPFIDAAGIAHSVALCLLPFVRPLIVGATPFHLIDAPTPGSGKSLLVELLAGIFSPHIAPMPADVRDDDEWRKRITAALVTGGSHVWFDNINRRVESGSLAAALTGTEWKDRLMGVNNREINVTVRCVWVGTGNNTALSDELTRRTIYIRLDPKCERPWDRDGFNYPDIRAFARENRPRLVAACLCLVRAWLAAGRPAYSGKPLGSFESWTKTMGGILETCGIPGFLANRDDLFDKADPERDDWTKFLRAWWEKYLDAKCAMVDLYPLAVEQGMVDGHEGKERAEKNVFGRALRSKIDRVFGTLRFVAAGTRDRAAVYQCQNTASTLVCENESMKQTESIPTPAYVSDFSIPPIHTESIQKQDSYTHVEIDSVCFIDSFHEKEEEENKKRSNLTKTVTATVVNGEERITL